jgi:hypothetical protein
MKAPGPGRLDNSGTAMRLVTLIVGVLLAQTPAAFEASLTGRVESLDTRAPVPYADVVLAPVGGSVDEYRTTRADAGGRFTFRNVPAGAFRVHAERQGYLRGEAGSRTAGIPGTPVTVIQGQTVPTVVITLTPTGVIAGRVVDGDGPVRGALVRALRVAYRDGERQTEMAAAATADDRGEYRLFSLAPGTYLVDAARPPRARIEGNEYVVPQIASIANGNRREMRTPLSQALAEGIVDPAAWETGALLPQLYPGTIDENVAIPVDVFAGATVPGIDVVMQHVPALTVSGRVIPGGASTSPEDVSIGIQRLNGVSVETRGLSSFVVEREANGGFVFRGIPAGRYQLSARTSRGPVFEYGRTLIEIGTHDVTGANIVMTPGLRVSGHFVVDGVRAVANDTLSVQLVARVNGVSIRQVAPDGSFVFDSAAPQDYWLRILSRGRTIAPVSIRFGADTIPDGIVTVTPDRQADELVIGVTLRTGGVDVTVTDRNRRPVSGTTVALIPEPSLRRYGSLFRTGSSGSDGRLQFNDVAPGRYTLVSGDVAPGDWQNPDILQRFEPGGVPVEVQPDARQRVSLVAP